MNMKDFLAEMKDVLQTETEITSETILADLEEWDSLSIMATMALLNKSFGVKTSLKDYKDKKTIGEIAKMAGIL